jgi:GH15 family glucan-1,4-alpha-glucosidase
MSSKIEDYGIIGNSKTVALVSNTGSIDWFCAPGFDSEACFASLIGYDLHGRWAFHPTVRVRQVRQRYLGDTLILATEFECDGGVVRLVDLMPPSRERCDIVRILEGVEGEVPFEMALVPRFGYGANRPWIDHNDDGVTLLSGPDALRFRSGVPTTTVDGALYAQLAVRQGEQLSFQLAWHPSHRAPPPPLDVERERSRTDAYWTAWASRCTYEGRFRDAVLRSLLTLKALTDADTGAVVAAPTASLPEEIGGVRNWDYRFCWLRDATLTLHALMFGGYRDEAAAFREWLLRAVAGDPSQVQIMYDVRGGRRLSEVELEWLPGYEASRPVRIGNAAANQLQIDIFGEVLSCIYAGRKMGLPEHGSAWAPGSALIEHLERVWQEPDEGIWEVRGGRRHFTYSKVMAWVAFDRMVRLIEEFGLGGAAGQARLPHWRALRERVHQEVCDRGFNRRIGAFTQSYGDETLDASLLLMPHVAFLPASDPRVEGTVRAIERGLVREGFVLRYATEHGVDGLGGDESPFLACSFWLADNYALAGRLDEAEAYYERLLGLRNHLGLLAEEYEPRLKRQLGNFPQGFSHLALMMTAHVLETVRNRQPTILPRAGVQAEP